MQFDSSYITTAGSALFARATASTSGGTSTPIVWGSVYTSSVDMRALQPEQIRALTSIPESERSSSGSVTSARHDVIDGNHVAKLECEIKNEQYSGIAYAIGVYAKLQGDTDEVLAAIARVDTNGSDPDTVPASGDYWAIIDFILTVRDDQLNLLEAPASYYASAQALQKLTNRVVTTHVESSDTTGEQQDVYGIKTFKNDTKHSGNILPTANTLNIGSNTASGKWSTVYATSFSGTADGAKNIRYVHNDLSVTNLLSAESEDKITSYSNIIPSSGTSGISNFTFGDDSHLWSYVYTDRVRLSPYWDSSTSTELPMIYVVSNNTANYDYSLNGIGVIGNIHPDDNDMYSIGNRLNRWKSMYSNAVHALGDSKNRGLILCDGDYEHRAYCSITGYQDGDNGRMTMHFVNATDNLEYRVIWKGPNANISGNETLTTLPQSTGTWSLGNDNVKLDSIYATNFYGAFIKDIASSIYGIIEDGSSGPFYNGTCSSSGTTRTVTCNGFSLEAGAVITILFTNANSSASTTLNVNSTGAKYVEAGSDSISWSANSLKTFRYTGSKWRAIKIDTISNYGVCSTASSTAAKTVAINNKSFRLETGARVIVKFSYYNAVSSPTLNVNGTGAKPIRMYGSSSPGTTAFDSWTNNETHEFVYDGTYWRCINYQYYSQSTSQVAVLGSSSNSNLPLLFTSSCNDSTTSKSNRTIYTDTENSLYYNPSTNVLTSSYLNTSKLEVTSARVTAKGDIIPNTTGSYYLGSSGNHWHSAYVDSLYIGTSAKSLYSYIDDRISNTNYVKDSGSVDNDYGYINNGGLFIASQITIRYGFFGSSDNWYDSRSNLHICRADSITCSNSDNSFTQIPNDYGLLLVRITSISFPFFTKYYIGNYRILCDLRWSDTDSQPSNSSTNRSYTFNGMMLCQYIG